MANIQVNDRAIAHLPIITSKIMPIHVDFLLSEVTQKPGRIGMTFAPGKQNIGLQAIWQRDLEQDLLHLRHHYGTETLVTLLEEPDLEHLQIPNLFDRVQAHGMRTHWFPIRDYGTPTSMSGLIELVQFILTAAGQQETIVIHCKAGLGRTGLVAAACLVAIGYTPEEAFQQVRRARPGTVETPEQEMYIDQFAIAWNQSIEEGFPARGS